MSSKTTMHTSGASAIKPVTLAQVDRLAQAIARAAMNKLEFGVKELMDEVHSALHLPSEECQGTPAGLATGYLEEHLHQRMSMALVDIANGFIACRAVSVPVAVGEKLQAREQLPIGEGNKLQTDEQVHATLAATLKTSGALAYTRIVYELLESGFKHYEHHFNSSAVASNKEQSLARLHDGIAELAITSCPLTPFRLSAEVDAALIGAGSALIIWGGPGGAAVGTAMIILAVVDDSLR